MPARTAIAADRAEPRRSDAAAFPETRSAETRKRGGVV